MGVNINAPAKYEQTNESLFRGNVDKALSALELKVSALDQTAANIIPSGNVEFIIDPITSAVTARVSPLANTNSFGVIVSNTAFDVARASQTLHDFASETTPFDLSLGVLAPGDVRYVTLWFYRAAGGLGVASPAAYGKRFDFTADVGPLAVSTDKLSSGAATIAKGGVGFTTYVTGDLIYASASNTLAKRGIGTSGQFLRESTGVPDWHTLVTADVTDLTTAATGITKLGTVTVGVWQATSISTSFTDAKIKTATGTANRLSIGGTATDPTFDVSTSYAGQATIVTLGTVVTGVWNGTAVVTTYGGTGLASYSAGDLLYYASGTTLSKLGIGTTDRVLTSSGSAPQWSSSLTGISTTGSAATLTTTRTIWGQNFNGSANVSGAMTGVSTISMSGALTYGGVTLTAAVTGTGKMVLDASPAIGSATMSGTTDFGASNIAGTPVWLANQNITLGTAAQPNVTSAVNLTSIGTLTSLTMGGGISGVTTLAGSGAVSGFTTINVSGIITSTAGQLTLSLAGAGDLNGVLMTRAGGTASTWEAYLPSGSTDLRLLSGSDRFTFTTAGAFIATGAGTFGSLLSLNKDAAGKAFRAYWGSGNNTPLNMGFDLSNGDAWLAWNATQASGSTQNYDISNNAYRMRGTGTTWTLASAPSGTAGNAITWTNVITVTESTHAVAFVGTVSTAVSGMTSSVSLAQHSASTTYGLLTFNGATTSSSMIGLTAGGGTDKNLYYCIPTGGGHNFRVNDVQVVLISGATDSAPNVFVAGPNTLTSSLYTSWATQSNRSLELTANAAVNNGGAWVVLSNSQTGTGVLLGALAFVASGTAAADKRGALVLSTLKSSAATNITADLVFYVSNAGTLAIAQTINADKSVVFASDVTAANINAGAANYLDWVGRSAMSSPSDGVILLSNNTVTNFTRLQFGGTTTSFPALRRNGAQLDVNLADDSAKANFSCAAIFATASSSTFASLVYSGQSASWDGSLGSVWPTTVSFVAGTTSSSSNGLGIGYDNSANRGVIQCASPNVAYRGLNLNPQGGTVYTGADLNVGGALTVSSFAPSLIYTSTGSTSIAGDSAFHTLFALSSPGLYLIWIGSGDAGTDAKTGFMVASVQTDGTASFATVVTANIDSLAAQFSGNNFQVKQSIATRTMPWKYLRLYS